MRIRSISQPAGQLPDGLTDIDIRGLNRIVLLAGANGSGKTRLLNRVQNGGNPGNRGNQHGQGFELDAEQGQAPVPFVAKNLNLADPAGMTADTVIQQATSAETPGAVHLAQSSLAYIQRVQTHWWNATHQCSEEPQSVREEKIRSYENLCTLIQTVLGAPLERDFDNHPTLFGRPIAKTMLSDGQKALLQWCTALHAQGIKLADLILVMDEPENHLHPESMISTMDRIVDANPNGQIRIATHSVPLIASLYKKRSNDLSVYYMQNGSLSFASEQPEIVLKSLMGGEANIESLREFIDLPEVLATNRFAAQCLTPPDVVAHAHETDPQAQIVNADVTANPNVVRMLDFGCGKGRLLLSLMAIHGPRLPNQIDYVGWDISDKHRPRCEQVIERTYNDASNRWFTDRQQLAEHHSGTKFDRIVLCNVLHEIEPSQWVDLFNQTSIVNQHLNDRSELLIIEDYLMPKGEYAHPFGFIVLDTESLQRLFGAGDGDDRIRVDIERKGRIKGHFVPKHLLANVNAETVRESLQIAQRNAKEKIRELRAAGDSDFKAGRAHGFWVQQYANTTLALG